MEPIIQIETISFAYQDTPVLEGVSFDIQKGDFVALIGSNGAGKSTLFKLLLGELTPDTGEIRLFGESDHDAIPWPRIGYVPQKGLLLQSQFPATADEIVKTNLRARKPLFSRFTAEDEKKVAEAFAAVGMSDYRKRLLSQLSGGQLQRVLLARALVGEPAVMILDEPTTGVDDTTALEFYTLLQELNRSRQLTILMVTHDIAKAHPFVTRTLCLEYGSVLEVTREQLTHELEHRHQHPPADHVHIH
ncbi:MAG: metal ABC transporter ATP-binding protein [Lachnospiraceae bacterium]|nr:metal ABC transporter ATP-binding protein [Lachnospiraceae bacterium]MDY5741468.1 metal ABC transporter ATP-binding protein [Lachnospiraceae bacterium]